MVLSIYSFDNGDSVATMLILTHQGRFFSDHTREEADHYMKSHDALGGLVSTIYPSGNFVTMVHMLHLDEVTPIRSVYNVDRCYGGPEEGGWWYSHYTHVRVLGDNEIFEIDDSDEVLIIEFFSGSHETKAKPYYC